MVESHGQNDTAQLVLVLLQLIICIQHFVVIETEIKSIALNTEPQTLPNVLVRTSISIVETLRGHSVCCMPATPVDHSRVHQFLYRIQKKIHAAKISQNISESSPHGNIGSLLPIPQLSGDFAAKPFEKMVQLYYSFTEMTWICWNVKTEVFTYIVGNLD